MSMPKLKGKLKRIRRRKGMIYLADCCSASTIKPQYYLIKRLIPNIHKPSTWLKSKHCLFSGFKAAQSQ